MKANNETALIASYPAYDVHAVPCNRNNVRRLQAGDQLTKQNHLGTFTIDSVVSSSLRDNRCPIKALERAKAFDHELVWINQNATVLSNARKEKTTVYEIHVGMRISFEGNEYTIEKAANDNLALKPVA